MFKFKRIFLFYHLLLLSIAASAQEMPDTFFLRKGIDVQIYKGDTMIVSRYNTTWRLKSIDFYILDKVQYSDDYFYSDTEYSVKRFYYNSTPKNKSIYKVFLTNGSLKLECEMKKNKIHGYFKTYYRNGSKMCDCHYTDGKRDSLNRVYYPNGNLTSIGYYKNGKLDETEYYEKGKLKNTIKAG